MHADNPPEEPLRVDSPDYREPARFRLFPFRFEERLFADWRVALIAFGLLPFLPWIVSLVIFNNNMDVALNIEQSLILNCIEDGGTERNCTRHYEREEQQEDIKAMNQSVPSIIRQVDIIFSLALLTFIGLSFAVAALARQIRPTFRYLLEQERLACPEDDLQHAYSAYLHDVQRRYVHWGRNLLVLGVLLFVLGALLFPFITVLGSIVTDTTYTVDFRLLLLVRLLAWFPMPLFLWAYLMGTGIWLVITTSAAIRGLTPRFRLRIQPNHPDHSGGLLPLGQLTFALLLPILAFMPILILLLLAPILPEHVLADTIRADVWARYGFDWAEFTSMEAILSSLTISIQIIAWIILLFLVVLLALTFIGSLYDITGSMRGQRRAYAEAYNREVAALNAIVWGEDSPTELSDERRVHLLEAATKKLEFLKTQHPDKIRYPVWPFDLGIRAAFITSLLVPVVSLLLNVYEITR